ncbi:hypothetical protein [Paraburkholderia lacunae]|uniref:Uncharacterized protein n=1 Tax=Paraburkholderia lacunae TaxID=2211104 RepID=A0A370N5A2_9BURK|nr:hypothetical protein [Paraburkholderia lacunae]RDK00791.1 hypothetical protein DLM46_20795 [Paraburkholderia lacunae]
MHKQDIQSIVDAARETADTIVGALEWNTAEDASAMHDVIFWDMIAKRLPNMSIADLHSAKCLPGQVYKRPGVDGRATGTRDLEMRRAEKGNH